MHLEKEVKRKYRSFLHLSFWSRLLFRLGVSNERTGTKAMKLSICPVNFDMIRLNKTETLEKRIDIEVML